jgi:hypothetical protein
MNPALELTTSLSAAVERAASERAQIESNELQTRKKELEAANQRAEAEAGLKEMNCWHWRKYLRRKQIKQKLS